MSGAGEIGGIIKAGADVYSAFANARNAADANKINSYVASSNRDASLINSLLSSVNNGRNFVQQGLDNVRYDDAVARENAQRQFTNKAATATQVDADGNIMEFDPYTGTWRARQTGNAAVNADRRRSIQGAQYGSALFDALVNGQSNRDRMTAGARGQGNERALAESLLARYAANQGRSPDAMQGAMIESQVANATDPLQAGGNSALLAGYRQGNSGNDALIGALTRNGQAGTRGAIANARLSAPMEALNERDTAAKAILNPANSLAARGSGDPGNSAAVFGGDTGSNLMASLTRPNPAGVGTTLSPQRAAQSAVNPLSTSLQGFTPLNASGNMGQDLARGVNNLINTGTRVWNWMNTPEEAPTTRSNTVSRSRYENQNEMGM